MSRNSNVGRTTNNRFRLPSSWITPISVLSNFVTQAQIRVGTNFVFREFGSETNKGFFYQPNFVHNFWHNFFLLNFPPQKMTYSPSSSASKNIAAARKRVLRVSKQRNGPEHDQSVRSWFESQKHAFCGDLTWYWNLYIEDWCIFEIRTSEAFWGRNEFGMGCRDYQLTTDASLQACVASLLSWEDDQHNLTRAWDDKSEEA